MLLVIYYFLLSTIAMQYNDNHHFESTYPKSRFSGSTEARAQAADPTCQDGMEEMIGQTKICKQCKPTFVPINGKCTAKAEATNCKKANGSDLTDDDTKCGQCTGETFMYKGGCYETTSPAGQQLCTKAAAGLCTAAAPGYFVPGDKVANTEQSVVSCGDATTGVTVAADSGNKYKGIANCEECTAPDAAAGARATDKFAKCTKCSAGKYLKDDGSTTQCVATANDCGDGYAAKQDADNGNQCVSCEDTTKGVTGCAKCTYDSASARIQCTRCTTNHLKKKADGSTECVADAQCDISGSAYYKVDDSLSGKKCILCSDAAGETWKGVKGYDMCTKSANINIATACDECSAGYTLDSQAKTCALSSTNKSGLSTGAIAGISVAAVVVVGGLVGFLCWWFICRGKA